VPNEQANEQANEQPNEQQGPGGESEILVDRRQDGVALVTLNRPKANALSVGLLGLLAESVAGLAHDRPGALVLWGGERIFAAGADINELSGSELSGPAAAARISDAFKSATAALSDLGCPSIAAISGYALGGGLELALGCDFRVAATSARLGQPEILLGIIPGGGGTQRLARLVGPARAKDLVMTGRQITAADALEWGLVDRVVANSEVLGTSLDLAAALAAGPRVAVAAAKRVIDDGLDTSLEAGLRIERDAFVAVLQTVDAKRGIESFAEHGPGKATFVGR
jgi:enoyl-CoA hydratase